jgi:LysM repeat protein
VAVNPVTNKIYVSSWVGIVKVIDGIDNTVLATLSGGFYGHAVAVNPMTNEVYVTGGNDDIVTVITPAPTEAIPLTTDITPLAGDTTELPRPTFSFSASSTFSPNTPPIGHIYYQVDTCTGPWLETSPAGDAGSGETPVLLLGTHLIFAFAVDGQEATSINTGQGSSPVIGQISAYHFLRTWTLTYLPLGLKGY